MAKLCGIRIHSRGRPKDDDLIRHFLMGHTPKGISQDYVALRFPKRPRDARGEEQISKRIVRLLGLTLGAHDDAPLVPAAPSHASSTRRKSKVGAQRAVSLNHRVPGSSPGAPTTQSLG